ncbi:MAG TPA: hypothetical protein VHU40_00815 [Polyangia bacterium]|nr:hypothetical protein [Polyangia bacterium]
MKGWPLATAGALLALGCGTTYTPRPTAHVGVVISRGGAYYVKNGQRTPVGPLGGDLAALVSESPAALAHAKAARADLSVGVPCYITGLGSVVVGILAFSGPVGWVMMGAGGAIGGTGLGLMGAGLTHAVDAVNIHNDAVDAR